ncbi:MAG: hypothetical protein ACKO2T_08745 [Microcystis aeruginosa]
MARQLGKTESVISILRVRRRSAVGSFILPPPHTPHPTPHTPHPSPHTPHPTPLSLLPAPQSPFSV